MSTFGKQRLSVVRPRQSPLWAYSVEKLRFPAKSENICPRSVTEEFWREVRLKRVSGSSAASWNLSWQSSRSFGKGVLLAEILEIPIWEFFNRISPLRTFTTDPDAAAQLPQTCHSPHVRGRQPFEGQQRGTFLSLTAEATLI